MVKGRRVVLAPIRVRRLLLAKGGVVIEGLPEHALRNAHLLGEVATSVKRFDAVKFCIFQRNLSQLSSMLWKSTEEFEQPLRNQT